MPDFESVRRDILGLPETDRRRLAAWLQSLGSVTTGPTPAFDSGGALYTEIARVLDSYGYETEKWERFARIRPALAGSVRSRAVQFDAAILRIFKGISRTDHIALRTFLVSCARSRCHDEDRQLTLRTILDCIYPLEELLDNRFPGLRTNGLLNATVLGHIHRTAHHQPQGDTT